VSGATKIEAPPGGFDVAILDPPWRYDNWTDANNGAAVSAYSTMSTDDIAELPVRDWMAPDSLLACWATWPKLRDATDVLAAWGADYITGLPFVKVSASGAPHPGTGFWVRGATEMLLMARFGQPKRPPPPCGLLLPGPDRDASWAKAWDRGEVALWGRRMAHSRKPDSIHEWLGQVGEHRLEAFARRKVDGWTCWGGDLGVLLTADGPVACEVDAGDPGTLDLFATGEGC